MSHEFSTPHALEITKGVEPLTPDDNEADTRLAVGTRKLMAVMFWLLKIELPPQEELDAHLEQVARDSCPADRAT